jgi:hypothetical protein
VFSINGDLLIAKAVDSPITAMSIPDLDEAAANRFLATGHANGSVAFWRVDLALADLVPLAAIAVARGPIAHICFDEGCQRAAVASDADVFALEFRGSAAPELRREYAAECCVCRARADPRSARACALCHRFFCKGCAADDPAQCRACAAVGR